MTGTVKSLHNSLFVSFECFFHALALLDLLKQRFVMLAASFE
jgi:hypothetical protein